MKCTGYMFRTRSHLSLTNKRLLYITLLNTPKFTRMGIVHSKGRYSARWIQWPCCFFLIHSRFQVIRRWYFILFQRFVLISFQISLWITWKREWIIKNQHRHWIHREKYFQNEPFPFLWISVSRNLDHMNTERQLCCLMDPATQRLKRKTLANVSWRLKTINNLD